MERSAGDVRAVNLSAVDLRRANAVLQQAVDDQLLAGVSTAVMVDGQVVDSFCTGLADLASGQPLRPDHIHRAFSNSKLITSVLVLLLADQGHWQLDDAIKRWLPAFGHCRVLRQGATAIGDTEPLQRDITIRHLLSHQAGLSHGVFDPGTLIFNAYMAAGVRRPDTPLAVMADALPALPLLYQPGEGWEYSMAADVLGRLVEIVTGQAFGDALQTRLFGPLGMADTGFVLRPDQLPRLATLYLGDVLQPLKPGLQRLDNMPWNGAHLKAVPRQSGAGGLFTTQADMLALLRQLMPGQGTLLQPATVADLLRDQLPPGRWVQLPATGAFPNLGFGLGGAVLRGPSPLEPGTPVGELQWGGLAGTHWWLSPNTGVAGVLMAQRHFGFWNPFWYGYKRRMYEALAAVARGPA